MPKKSLTAGLRVLGDERGLALPFALGVTLILAALSVGIFAYVTTNQGAAKRSHADQRAYGLAETGVSYAVSTLQNAADPWSASSVPTTTVSLPGGSVTYTGSLSGSTWTLTGTGTVANPSGPLAANVVRTASVQASVQDVTVGDPRPWNYLFIDQPIGCFTLSNAVTVEVALYVRGDLCIQNNVLIKSPVVHVLGSVYVNHQASIGTSGAPISEFLRTGNCFYAGTQTTCGPTARIWANSVGTNPPVISKPPIDLPYWYSNADLGPLSGCSVGSFPGGFDTDTTRNMSRGTVDLTPATAYTCRKVVNGQTVAEISWAPGSNPSQTGVLTVKGTIYFDGNLTWTNLNKIDYNGRATIYASGQLVIANQARLCGVANCDATWDPSVDFLAFTVGSMTTTGTDPLSGDVGNNVNFQGALYMVNDYDQDNLTTIWGPVIARSATITNSGTFKALPGSFGELLPGMPASPTTQTRVTLVQGSYSG